MSVNPLLVAGVLVVVGVMAEPVLIDRAVHWVVGIFGG